MGALFSVVHGVVSAVTRSSTQAKIGLTKPLQPPATTITPTHRRRERLHAVRGEGSVCTHGSVKRITALFSVLLRVRPEEFEHDRSISNRADTDAYSLVPFFLYFLLAVY